MAEKAIRRGGESPAAAITSAITIRINRILFSSDPPNSSFRWLVDGDKNWLMR